MCVFTWVSLSILFSTSEHKHLNFLLLTFSNQACYFSLIHSRGIMDYFYLASLHATFPTSQDWCVCTSHTADAARWNKDIKRCEQTEREYLTVSAESFLFSHFVAAWDASPTQHVSMWCPGNETQQSAIFVVCSGTAGTLLQCGLSPPLVLMLVMCHMHIFIFG